MNVCTYLMPIRRSAFNRAEAEELHSYLGVIRGVVSELMVVDGSPADVFAAHDQLWSDLCRHQHVNRQFGFRNDKVNGIYTGLHAATTGRIILADDDIRYTPENVREIVALLDRFDVVRPQNFFAFGKIATAAKMEAARMLINRATLRTADYPGTCAFRRELLLDGDKYDGDVLFDNEELVRHFARLGANIYYANDFFIRKKPPAFRKWLEQRPRQAYEDFGLRTKTILFAGLPLIIVGCGMLFGVKPALFAGVAVASVAVSLAMMGRARGMAKRFFPFHICLFAPLWIFERCLSTYWALYWFFRRGGYPFGGTLLQRGIGRDWVAGGRIAAQSVSSSSSPGGAGR